MATQGGTALKVELWDIERVKEYEGNPRQISDEAVEAVAGSIREFGFKVPVIVDKDGVLIAGHTRVRAARKLGVAKVPVIRADDLSPEQVRAFRLADNRLGEMTTWDYQLLPVELSDLQGADFDLSLLGFDAEELSRLLDPGVQPGQCDPDEVPAPPDEAVTRPGDLYVLGDHRLLCGDSGKVEDVDRLLDGAAVHLVNTDPPYGVKVAPRSGNAMVTAQAKKKYTGQQGMDAKLRGRVHATTEKLRPKDRPLEGDFVSDEEFARLLRAWFGNIARVLQPGRSYYLWGGYSNIWNYPNALKGCALYFSQMIIWDKQHPVLTRKDFMGAHEWCQPPDTSVLTPDGSSAIQSLCDGDRVVSFSRHSGVMIGLRQGLGVHTTSRAYSGPLYQVVVGDRGTWCTNGHVWSVRMTPAAKRKWCVYLMQRGNWWRVGRCKLYTTWGLGLKQRLMMEDGEAAWILNIYDDKDDATLAEQIVSIAYGIPTTFWNETRASRRTEAMIAKIYDHLDPDGLERAARKALTDHQRSIYYPFISRGQTRHKHNARTSHLVRACNLLPGAMAVPVPRRGQAFNWLPVRAVDVQPYSGMVYSMSVDKYYHYVADGIITHNCFYGWKEGSAHVFYGPANVPDLWHVKKIPPQQMEHLTCKPVELAVRAIQYSSLAGENVLDLFGGSGSTLIAAEQTGRKSYLMEIDPLYADLVADRYQRFTGRPAILERTGTSPIPMKPREEKMR